MAGENYNNACALSQASSRDHGAGDNAVAVQLHAGKEPTLGAAWFAVIEQEMGTVFALRARA